jgi:RNA polymerase sigma factor (sigma-70 family)|nr:sigma-70 family RNA polymerase sigma factor [Candidatus Acidoferrales bacterium]
MKVDMNAGEDIKLELPQVGIGRRTEADAALEDVFRAQYPRLISVLARVTSDRAQAEELASEVFCKLAKRPALFRPGNNLEGWLYRAAMNLALDNLKAGARRRRHEDAAALENIRESSRSSASPLDDLLRAEQRGNVRAVLAELKPICARLLLLRNTGFSYRELAQVLEVNPASIGKLLLRSMAEFEQKYKEMYEVKT